MEKRLFQKNPALRGFFQKWCFLLLPVLLLLGGCQENPPVTGIAFLMDTIVEYKLYGSPQAGKAVEEALQAFEAKCSRYVSGSEIDLLNQAAGEKSVTVSPEIYDLLEQSRAYGEESKGVFDVTIAPAADLWNITGDSPRIPSGEELRAVLPLVGYEGIVLEKNGNCRLAQKGQKVDLGGIGKGYACNIAREIALDNGVTHGYVSIGGNVMVIGKKSRREDFKFGIRDPRGGGNDYVAVMTLPDEIMATSGDYERYFEEDGTRYHHILDPATGAPAQTDLMSVSVVASDGAYADYMSTYLFIQGKQFALEHLNDFPCGLVLIDKEKNIYVSDGLTSQFLMADKTGTYHYAGDAA